MATKTPSTSKLILLCYILGLTLLFLNDWYWKYQYHNWLTGKLSDFIGLAIFPVFISLIFPKTKKYIVWIVALGFILWKTPLADYLIDIFNAYSFFKVARVVDYSDYIALFCLPLVHYLINSSKHDFLLNHLKKDVRPAFKVLVIGISLFVFSSTSRPRPNYPEGDILIEASYDIKLPKDEILERLKKQGYKIRIDSIYQDENYRIGMPYFQIEEFVLNSYASEYPDTIRNINFYLSEYNLQSSFRLINLSVSKDWELQDWKTLRSQRKRYKRIIERYLINKLKKDNIISTNPTSIQ